MNTGADTATEVGDDVGELVRDGVVEGDTDRVDVVEGLAPTVCEGVAEFEIVADSDFVVLGDTGGVWLDDGERVCVWDALAPRVTDAVPDVEMVDEAEIVDEGVFDSEREDDGSEQAIACAMKTIPVPVKAISVKS